MRSHDRVVEAYEVLSDPNLRVLYDEGENVDADDANKPFDFKFNVDPEDMENKTDDGKVVYRSGSTASQMFTVWATYTQTCLCVYAYVTYLRHHHFIERL